MTLAFSGATPKKADASTVEASSWSKPVAENVDPQDTARFKSSKWCKTTRKDTTKVTRNPPFEISTNSPTDFLKPSSTEQKKIQVSTPVFTSLQARNFQIPQCNFLKKISNWLNTTKHPSYSSTERENVEQKEKTIRIFLTVNQNNKALTVNHSKP